MVKELFGIEHVEDGYISLNKYKIMALDLC